jgi:hypothetical protein
VPAENGGLNRAHVRRRRYQLYPLQKPKQDGALVRVEPCQKGQVVPAGSCFMRFALFQDSVRIRLQYRSDCVQALFGCAFASICERHVVQGSNERICTLYMIDLMLKQGIVSMVVEFLYGLAPTFETKS